MYIYATVVTSGCVNGNPLPLNLDCGFCCILIREVALSYAVGFGGVAIVAADAAVCSVHPFLIVPSDTTAYSQSRVGRTPYPWVGEPADSMPIAWASILHRTEIWVHQPQGQWQDRA